MQLSFKDLRKYLIFVLFLLWIMFFFHLFYIYLQSLGEEKAVRGGVLLEGVVLSPINPLPYIGNNYYSKYVQSFLYKSCLDDDNKEEICSVKTNDNKTFDIMLSGNHYWSDGRKITLDDIYFTYNDVIKENSLKLENKVPNNISSIEKFDDKIKISFEKESINNLELFKNIILPKHILDGKTKDYYVSKYLKDFVNSSCVSLDHRSDFINNIILDYKDCEDYYINSYQFLLLNDVKEIANYITGTNKIDIFNSYENINPEIFDEISFSKNVRYSFFFNTFRQLDSDVKSFLSSKILSELKDNISIANRLMFNGYGLFQLPESNLTKDNLKEKLEKQIINNKKNEYKNKLEIITGNTLNYVYGGKNTFLLEDDLVNFLVINGDLGTGGYERFSISQNGAGEYFPGSYNGKTFKYVLSNTFKNIKEGKNTYTLYAYNLSGDKKELDEITLYYKNIDYPEFELTIPDFTIVYLDDGFISDLGDAISSILENYYPGKVVSKKVIGKEYEEILNAGDYDMVVGNINFDGKDISALFKTKDPISNPSLFVNQNFASLISQNLLASLESKKDIFNELDKIYKQFIPMVIIGNEKEKIYINKKYNIDNSLDYSSFENRKKMIKSIVINSIKKPVWDEVSFSGFIDFLKKEVNYNGY